YGMHSPSVSRIRTGSWRAWVGCGRSCLAEVGEGDRRSELQPGARRDRPRRPTLRRRVRHPVLVVLGIVLGTSTRGGSPPLSTPTARRTASKDAPHAAVGRAGRTRGPAQREKLGDTINIGDLSVRCEDFRFPDDAVSHTATAEGTLAVVRDEPATVS